MTGQNVIWSSFLFQDKADVEAYLRFFKERGMRQLLICPNQEWVDEWTRQLQDKTICILGMQDGIIDGDRLIEHFKTIDPYTTIRVIKRKTSDMQANQDTQFLSFWSVKPGMGVSTLAQSVSVQLAEAGKRVLYVEWDTFYTDVAIRFGLVGDKHGLQNYARYIEQKPDVLPYIINKEKWLKEYNIKEHRASVKELPDQLDVLSATEFNPKEPVSLTIQQAKDVLNQVDGLYDYVIIHVPSTLIHTCTIVSIEKSNKLFIVLDDKSIHLYQTVVALEELKPVMKGDVEYVINRTGNKAVIQEVTNVLGKAPFVTIPYFKEIGSDSYRYPFAKFSKYRHGVRLITDSLIEGEREISDKAKKAIREKQKNTLKAFLSTKEA